MLSQVNKKQVYSATSCLAQGLLTRSGMCYTDIVFHSTYPQAEIDKEVEVIIDEIDSYRDSPAELIFDEFEQLVYGDAPLGRDILGSPETPPHLYHCRCGAICQRTLRSAKRRVLRAWRSGDAHRDSST